MTIYVEATFNPSAKLLNASSLLPFITSMLCLTLATNVLTTCASVGWHSVSEYLTPILALIVYRIWSIRKPFQHRSAIVVNSPLTRVLVVLIESGLLYTFSIIILFGLYMASNNGQYGVSDAVSAVPVCPSDIPELMLPAVVVYRSSKSSWAIFLFWFYCAQASRCLSFRGSHSTWLSQVWIVATDSNPLSLLAHILATNPARKEMFRCTWSTSKRLSRDIQIRL